MRALPSVSAAKADAEILSQVCLSSKPHSCQDTMLPACVTLGSSPRGPGAGELLAGLSVTHNDAGAHMLSWQRQSTFPVRVEAGDE